MLIGHHHCISRIHSCLEGIVCLLLMKDAVTKYTAKRKIHGARLAPWNYLWPPLQVQDPVECLIIGAEDMLAALNITVQQNYCQYYRKKLAVRSFVSLFCVFQPSRSKFECVYGLVVLLLLQFKTPLFIAAFIVNHEASFSFLQRLIDGVISFSFSCTFTARFVLSKSYEFDPPFFIFPFSGRLCLRNWENAVNR